MPKFRKIPVEIEARQYVHGALEANKEIALWSGGKQVYNGLIIDTLEGEHLARYGYWIIQGVKGEFYGCEPEIFNMTYEAVKGE